jgi:hypothetical protein
VERAAGGVHRDPRSSENGDHLFLRDPVAQDLGREVGRDGLFRHGGDRPGDRFLGDLARPAQFDQQVGHAVGGGVGGARVDAALEAA